MTKRVLLAGFKHETHTFSVLPADIPAYRARALYENDEVAAQLSGTRTEMAALLDACERFGWTPVHPIYADATPSGPVSREAYEYVAGRITTALVDQGPFDAVLLVLHGAMVAEHTDDGEGELLARIRNAVGPRTPVAATLDLHANVTERMAEQANILISYRTYPHVDHYEIATRTAELVARALAGEIRPQCSVARGNMLTGVDDGRTNVSGPMSEMLERARQLEADPQTLSVSINAGFAYADMPQTGPNVVVVSDGGQVRHTEMARALVGEIWESRHRVSVEPVGVPAAIERALRHRANRPLVMADAADNPGGGGYGDATALLRGMIEAQIEDAVFATLYDPETARVCVEAGTGAELSLNLGGKVDPSLSNPIQNITARVIQLTDGRFALEGPMAAGTQIDLGPTAVIRIGGIDVVVASRRFQTYDRMFFVHAGITPEERSVVVVKSQQHFRAAFGPMAAEVLVVDSGDGLTTDDLHQLKFNHLRRPIFPLDLD